MLPQAPARKILCRSSTAHQRRCQQLLLLLLFTAAAATTHPPTQERVLQGPASCSTPAELAVCLLYQHVAHLLPPTWQGAEYWLQVRVAYVLCCVVCGCGWGTTRWQDSYTATAAGVCSATSLHCSPRSDNKRVCCVCQEGGTCIYILKQAACLHCLLGGGHIHKHTPQNTGLQARCGLRVPL